MKVLTIANRKGGAGKSTCAAHLSVEAQKSGKKTILIDMDPQKSLETWWNKREDDFPQMAEATYKDLSSKLLAIKTKGFDLCIIDTPGDISANATSAIEAADLVLVPSKATAPDLSAIGRTIATINEQKKTIVFVLTQVVPRTRNSLQAMSILSEYGQVAPGFLTNRQAYGDAMGQGTSASESSSNISKELSSIWKCIDERLFGDPKPKKAKVA